MRRCSNEENSQIISNNALPVRPVQKFIHPVVIGASEDVTQQTFDKRPARTSYSKLRKPINKRRNLSEDRAKRNSKSKSQEKQRRNPKGGRYQMLMEKQNATKSKNKFDTTSKDGVTSVSSTTNASRQVKSRKGNLSKII